jgi:hypothetical protein
MPKYNNCVVLDLWDLVRIYEMTEIPENVFESNASLWSFIFGLNTYIWRDTAEKIDFVV